MTTRVKIDHIGSKGDGIVEGQSGLLYVPFSVDGDDLEVKVQGKQARIRHIHHRSPDRIDPICENFGRCGGCSLQHVSRDYYVQWKQQQIRTALSHRGFEDVAILPPEISPLHSRRRARFSAIGRYKGTAHVGFSERGSHNIIDVKDCPVLQSEIMDIIAPLRQFLGGPLKIREKMAIQINLTENGLDLVLEGAGEPELDLRMDIAAFAEQNDIARICWLNSKSKKATHEILCERRQPYVHFAERRVFLPPGSFLQATKQGEQALTDFVKEAVGDADKVVDIFAGCGTFTIALIGDHAVHAVEGDQAMVMALKNSARQMGRIRNLTTEVRDLFLRPLLPHELKAYDAVVIDPPRAGARDQMAEIATSDIGRVVMISCNPASFARDARTLIDAGFQMGEILPVDQFLYSPHMEVIAVFQR